MRANEFLLEDNPDYDEDRFLKSDPGTPIPFPKGTTLVNVSDVYDWYKLGMAVSDLDDADPRTFNRGVPHTVFAFGSEEEEHRMIPLLKRLGFSLHDIDSPEDYQKAIRASDVIEHLEKIVDEGKIIGDKELVDIYLRGRHRGEMIEKKVGERIPNKLVNAFIDKVAAKFGLHPSAFVYGPCQHKVIDEMSDKIHGDIDEN